MLAACTPASTVKPGFALYNGPVTSELLASHIAFINVPGLRSEIKARLLQGGQKVGSAQGVIVARPPEGIRLVLFSPLGTTMMDAVYYGGNLSLYIPKQNAIYREETPSLWPSPSANLVMHASPTAYYLYELKDTPSGTMPVREYIFDRDTLHNTSATVFEDGHPVLVAEFSDFDQMGRPATINIMMRSTVQAEVHLKEPEFDQEVPQRKFDLPVEGRLILPLASLRMEEK